MTCLLDDRDLDREEAANALRVLKCYTTQEDFDSIFDSLDTNGNGVIDWTVSHS